MKRLILLTLIITTISCKDDKKAPIIDEAIPVETDSVLIENVIEDKLPIEKTVAQIRAELIAKGFETFDYVDEKTQDTILMQKYFMAFLKRGPIRSQNEEEAAKLQEQHMAHLGRMYEEGYADLIGPFGDDGDIRGITVYNVPTLKMADSLANLDPMVKAGRLVIEVHPWWCAKGYSLR